MSCKGAVKLRQEAVLPGALVPSLSEADHVRPTPRRPSLIELVAEGGWGRDPSTQDTLC